MSRGFSASEEKHIALQLNKQLGPGFISNRPGPFGKPLQYVDGSTVIQMANSIFGFNGWSSKIISCTTDLLSEEGERITCCVSAHVQVTLRDGTIHEDVGQGSFEGRASKLMALKKCKKEAVTDGLKRALRLFGNALGLCIHDREYLLEISKLGRQPSGPRQFNEFSIYNRKMDTNESLNLKNQENQLTKNAGNNAVSAATKMNVEMQDPQSQESQEFTFSELDEEDLLAYSEYMPNDSKAVGVSDQQTMTKSNISNYCFDNKQSLTPQQQDIKEPQRGPNKTSNNNTQQLEQVTSFVNAALIGNSGHLNGPQSPFVPKPSVVQTPGIDKGRSTPLKRQDFNGDASSTKSNSGGSLNGKLGLKSLKSHYLNSPESIQQKENRKRPPSTDKLNTDDSYEVDDEQRLKRKM